MDQTRFENFEHEPQYFENRRLKPIDPQGGELEETVKKVSQTTNELKEKKKDMEKRLKDEYKGAQVISDELQKVNKQLKTLDERIDQYENRENKSMMKISILDQKTKKLIHAKERADMQKSETRKSQVSKTKSLKNLKTKLKKKKEMSKFALDFSKYSLFKKNRNNYYNRLEEKYHNGRKAYYRSQEDLINKRRNKLGIQFTENLLRLREASNAYKCVEKVSNRIARQKVTQLRQIRAKEKEILKKMDEEEVAYNNYSRISNIEKNLQERYTSMTYISPPEKKKLPPIKKNKRISASCVFEKKKNDSQFNASQTTAVGQTDDEDDSRNSGNNRSGDGMGQRGENDQDNHDGDAQDNHDKTDGDAQDNQDKTDGDAQDNHDNIDKTNQDNQDAQNDNQKDGDEIQNGLDENEMEDKGYQGQKMAFGGQGQA